MITLTITKDPGAVAFPYEVSSEDSLAYVDHYGDDQYRQYSDALEYAEGWAAWLGEEHGWTVAIERREA